MLSVLEDSAAPSSGEKLLGVTEQSQNQVTLSQERPLMTRHNALVLFSFEGVRTTEESCAAASAEPEPPALSSPGDLGVLC